MNTDAESVRGEIAETISASIGSFCRENGIRSIWREPLVGFADALSPLFPQLREIAYRDHRLPQDFLPGARIVISYFLPFTDDVSEGNIGGTEPSPSWISAYRTTNDMAVGINSAIAGLVESMGSRACVPRNIGQVETYSIWSQRHIARITGLGNFGMNNMLISDSGCCGRYFSVITDLDITPDRPCTGERCTYKVSGRCGICMKRCICSALTPDGFLRDRCNDVCQSNARNGMLDVCGKCVVGLPCSGRSPV